MNKNSFTNVKMDKNNPKWSNAIKRQMSLYIRENDVRSDFTRDYNRILHCAAYSRLKHKTQVFFATRNDHICTRIEHVNHVAAVSYSIANFLGLNTELTNAIALGHDLGHAPFGHAGGLILNAITKKELKLKFWHEYNSLHFVDNIETLPNEKDKQKNLNLTYAVRDGIVAHCGEVKSGKIFPRDKVINLLAIKSPGQIQPYTWEGCVVKVADKISYLGRDIEDARLLKILTPSQTNNLEKILNNTLGVKLGQINNTILIHNFIADLCKSSSPYEGLRFSKKYADFIEDVKIFNDKNIYNHERLSIYKEYAKLIINSVFTILNDLYDKQTTYEKVLNQQDYTPILATFFLNWLLKFSDLRKSARVKKKSLKKGIKIRNVKICSNKIIYFLNRKSDYTKAVIDFISGMSDSFAIKVFNEITSF